MWPFVEVILKRLDNTEILVYKTYQTTKKIDQERKARQFEEAISSSFTSATQLPPINGRMGDRVAPRSALVTHGSRCQPLSASKPMSTGMSVPLASIPQMPTNDELKQLAKRVAVVEKYIRQQPANAELIT